MGGDSRVAIVTGGASGIGLGISTKLVSKGWRVVLADINPQTGEKAARDLGESARFHQTDVSSWESQTALFKKTFSDFGRLDFFAANAGIDDKKSIYEEDTNELALGEPQPPFLKVIDVDLIAVIWGVKLAAWYMRRNPNGQKGGSIVITSSMAGLYPMATNPLYASCKAALINFTRSVGDTYNKEGIRVNAICPALVPTALFPGKVEDFFPLEHITPISTITSAYETFIEDETKFGQVVECSQDQHYYREQPEYPSESQRWVNEDSAPCWDRAYKIYYASGGKKP